MEIIKNNHNFRVDGDYSLNWFKNNKLDCWEQDTFHILEYYKNKEDGIYIDIGAWIGPTVLYAANIYNKIIAIEPDTVAIERLEKNLSVNNFNNIVLIKKGLSDKNGESVFGGNGPLGNSESTLLVARDNFFTYEGRHTTCYKNNHPIIKIETINIETLITENNIDPTKICLIKMDIEGGEIIVVPALKDFLIKYKPVLYISLHYDYLKYSDIQLIIDILFDIYEKCYYFAWSGVKILTKKDEILNKRLSSIVFE
jgi:FkbM family methyltransferase